MAKARLKAARIRMMTRPLADDGTPLDPKLPNNVTEITSEELGDIHSQFAIMTQYAIQITAIADIERAARARIDKFTRAKTHLFKTGTVQDKAAKVETDPAVQKSSFETLKSDSTHVLTRAMLDSYLTGRDLCSREMTRRMSESSYVQGRST